MIVVFLWQFHSLAEVGRTELALRDSSALIIQVLDKFFTSKELSLNAVSLFVVATEPTLVAMDYRPSTLLLNVVYRLFPNKDSATALRAADGRRWALCQNVSLELAQ